MDFMKTGVRVVKNSIALMGGYTFGVIANLLSIGMIARYLPLKVFGDYGFVLAISMTFAIIIDMGTNQILIREIARNRNLTQQIFSAGLILKVFFSIICFSLIVITIHLILDSRQLIYSAYICALAIVVFMMGDIFDDIFKAYEKMEYSAYLKIIEETTYILGIIAVVFFDLGLNGVFLAMLFTYMIRIVVGFVTVSKKFFSPRIRLDMPTIEWIFKESYPIGISKIFRTTSLRIDTILLKILRNREEVGLFHGIYRIIIVGLFIPRNITDSIFPLFSKYSGKHNVSLNTAFEKSFKFIFILVLPLIFAAFLISDKIITIILGSKFLDAVPLFQLLIFLWGVTFFSVLCNKILNASDHQKFATIATGVCLIINVILDLILIPRYGYMGAGYATCGAEIVLFIAMFSFVYRYVCQISIIKVIIRPLISGGVAVVTGLVVANDFTQYAYIISIFISIVVYIFMLIILKVFDTEELSIIKEVIHRVRSRLSG